MKEKKEIVKLFEEKLVENSPVLVNNIDLENQCGNLNVVSSQNSYGET